MALSILDFWEFKNNNNLSVEELKQYAQEFYAEDFIENGKKWKANIEEINELMRIQLADKDVDVTHWENMSFDYFCKNMINYINEWIDENKDIEPKNISAITERLLNKYMYLQLHEMEKKHYTLPNLLASIVKPIIN